MKLSFAGLRGCGIITCQQKPTHSKQYEPNRIPLCKSENRSLWERRRSPWISSSPLWRRKSLQEVWQGIRYFHCESWRERRNKKSFPWSNPVTCYPTGGASLPSLPSLPSYEKKHPLQRLHALHSILRPWTGQERHSIAFLPQSMAQASRLWSSVSECHL